MKTQMSHHYQSQEGNTIRGQCVGGCQEVLSPDGDEGLAMHKPHRVLQARGRTGAKALRSEQEWLKAATTFNSPKRS